MQACGVSVYRLLRPVAFIALVATAITGYVTHRRAAERQPDVPRDHHPGGGVAGREQRQAARVLQQVFPIGCFTSAIFPPAAGGATSSSPTRRGRARRTCISRATAASSSIARRSWSSFSCCTARQHQTLAAQPDQYEGTDFESISLNLDPQTVFPPPPSRGVPEMTIADLRRTIVEAEKRGDTILGYSSRFMIQYKFSFPVACCVLALIGLALGVSNRKDGKLASFVIGISVIFVYYVLLYMARARRHGGRDEPRPGAVDSEHRAWRRWHLSAPVAGAIGRSADPDHTAPPPRLRRARRRSRRDDPMIDLPAPSARAPKVIFVIRVPHFNLPWSILDVYTSRQYLRVFVLTVLASLGIFYISTFIDLADKLFRGAATTALLLQYFYYQTPQYVYYIIPMAVLVATLVTIGMMTKNSELLVMRACGVSLYRTALPLLLFAVAASGVLFAMQEQVLAPAQSGGRPAEPHDSRLPRPDDQRAQSALGGRATSGEMYHYDFFDPRANRFARFTLYHLDQPAWRLSAMTYAEESAWRHASPGGTHGRRRPCGRRATAGCGRVTLRKTKNVVEDSRDLQPFAERALPLEPPGYFKTEMPDAQKMTYGQLSDYITQLKASGVQRRAARWCASAQGRVSLRHGDHDAAGGALRRHHRPARGVVRHRHRHRACRSSTGSC